MGLVSGIRKKPIPDPGSRGQKGTGSRIPDPQHCFREKTNAMVQHTWAFWIRFPSSTACSRLSFASSNPCKKLIIYRRVYPQDSQEICLYSKLPDPQHCIVLPCEGEGFWPEKGVIPPASTLPWFGSPTLIYVTSGRRILARVRCDSTGGTYLCHDPDPKDTA